MEFIESHDDQSSSPDCGRRLLNHLIDERAAAGHRRPFASIPITNRVAGGYRDISYLDYANAINRLAQWLFDHVGPPDREFEPIVYVAAGDLRYHVLSMAAVKVGYVVRICCTAKRPWLPLLIGGRSALYRLEIVQRLSHLSYKRATLTSFWSSISPRRPFH